MIFTEAIGILLQSPLEYANGFSAVSSEGTLAFIATRTILSFDVAGQGIRPRPVFRVSTISGYTETSSRGKARPSIV